MIPTENFWDPCWACRVLERKASGCIVTESAEVAVLVHPIPIVAGQVLVVPRRHVPNLYELPEELAGPILVTATRVARAMRRAFEADGITLRQNNEAASDQHLMHFHLHLIPRFAGDGEIFSISPRQLDGDEQEHTGRLLREALSR